MNRFNKKRNLYITIALITILLIGLGYAFLTSNLNIIGNTNINKNTWGVEFENVQVTSGSVEASTPQISNKTTVNYTVTLDKPGDFYEFTVDASNKGSIDAMIDSVSNTGLTTEQKKYMDYSATYSDGTEIKNKQELKSNQKETIKVRIDYKKDITASDLPSENQQLNLTFTIEYVQADDSSELVRQPICKRATTLHTETCLQTGTHGCKTSDSGYNTGDTITYGSLGTSGTLAAGDAFDCDVNGDGTYDPATERFYYIKDLDTNSNYGVLLYFYDVRNGQMGNDSDSMEATGYGIGDHYSLVGPTNARSYLPTTSQWSNVSLSNTTRKIKDESNTEYLDFSYEGYAARLLTLQEIESVCNITVSSNDGKEYYDISHQCHFLKEVDSYWVLETIVSQAKSATFEYGDDWDCWIFTGSSISWDYIGTGDNSVVRPAIEVPKSKISY